MATLTDEQFALADRIEGVLDGDVEKWWRPSDVSRKLSCDVAQVRPVLQWMAKNSFVRANREDLNSRTYYRSRSL